MYNHYLEELNEHSIKKTESSCFLSNASGASCLHECKLFKRMFHFEIFFINMKFFGIVL